MDFFKLKNKDKVLCSLNGNKATYRFANGDRGLTTDMNKLRARIEIALMARNFDVPGIDCEFYYSFDDDTNRHSVCMHAIRCTDPKLVADVEILSWRVRVAGLDVSIHEDQSGALEVYCGNDWANDRKEFICGKRFHQKMDKRRKTVLQYEKRGGTFVSNSDCDRGYLPEGDEPTKYTMSEVEKLVLEGMNDVLEYIESHKEPTKVDQFVEPNPVYLTNPLFAGSKFHTHVKPRVLDRINDGKGNHGITGGWRLLDLSVPGPKDHPYVDLMNDGFIYCDIEWRDGKIESNNWHYAWPDEKSVTVIPEKVDNVFVVDQGVAESFKKDWFDKNPGQDSLPNAMYHEMAIARANTMVHINDYKGGFSKPVIVINRTLSTSEIHPIVRA